MIQIIGWTLLHSLWQITLIGLIYWLVKNTWQQKSALRQYYLAVSVLISSFLFPFLTFCYFFKETFAYKLGSALIPEITESTISQTLAETNNIITETSLNFSQHLVAYFPYLVAFWALGVFCFSIRFINNLRGIKYLQNTDDELIGREWLTKIEFFKEKLSIQKEVQVFLSKYAKEPITFGHFKPIILLPISLVTGFNQAAVETMILHELAHIKRNDYLVNLGQSIIEIILFYHPLVWWISKEVRELREYCCDDLVLSMGENRDTYVATLTALQWRKIGAVSNRLSLSANGKEASFSKRIKRMFGVEGKRYSYKHLMGLFLLLLITAFGAVALQNFDWRKLFYENETGVDYPEKTLTYVIDYQTDISEIRAMQKEVAELGISIGDLSFCSTFNRESFYDQVGKEMLQKVDRTKSIHLNYFRQRGEMIPLNITDLSATSVRLTFDNGYLKKPELLDPTESIKIEKLKRIFTPQDQSEQIKLLFGKYLQPLASETKTVSLKDDTDTLKNIISWGGQNYPFVYRINKPSVRLHFTKKKWQQLHNQPFALKIDGEWLKVKRLKEIVLVPHKKDPVAVNSHKPYREILQDQHHSATKLLARAKAGDFIYFEEIELENDLVVGLVVKIIKDDATGFIPKEDIQFDKAELFFSKEMIDASQIPGSTTKIIEQSPFSSTLEMRKYLGTQTPLLGSYKKLSN